MNDTYDKNKRILLQVATNEVEFLLFALGSQRYGINVSKVCQILVFDPSKIAHLPKQAPELLGVTTFRDKSISVIDLRQHLDIIPLQGASQTNLLLVTEFNQRTTGFIIDSVDHIVRCSWEQFEPITDTVCDKAHGTVVGTVTLKDGIVVILDLETILSKIDPAAGIDYYKDTIAPAGIDRSKVSIVYCEDSVVVQKLMVQTLESAGFKKVQTFKTGLEGLAFLETTAANKVDIILSDIEMPKMDGLTLCKKIRALPDYDQVPFVFFSSTINEQMDAKCRSVGANCCFSKPQVTEMIDAIEKLAVARTKP